MRFVAFTLALLVCAAPSHARQHFQPYEGKDAVQEGRGGTRVTRNGVDFWSNGTPPRRFQVIGMMEDRRGNGVLAGEIIGSASIAKATRKAGGDAVIVLSSNVHSAGVVGGVSNGNFWAGSVEKRTTQLIVIKYLD